VFVEYLSKGLNKEFKGKGVHICSVHPGPMNTNAEVSQRIKNQTAFTRIGVETPEYVAKLAIHRMFKKSPLIVIGKGNRIHWALMKTLPNKVVLMSLTYGMKKELNSGKSL
jgi:short-subunit dehydrogenase